MSKGSKTLQDIEEIPVAVDNVIKYRSKLEYIAKELLGISPKKIFFIGCGSSYYLALLIQSPLVRVMNHVFSLSLPSSEAFIYYNELFDDKAVVIGISRSGETAETLTALEKAKARGSYTILLSITNESRGKHIVDKYVYLDAGIERSIVMTKSFVTLSLAGLLLTSTIREYYKGEHIKQDYLYSFKNYVEEIIQYKDNYLEKGRMYAEKQIERFVFLGSGPSYAIALEGSLKFKETSYVATEAIHALEFRHGPMATIGENQVEVIINPSGESYDLVYRLYKDIQEYEGKILRLSDRDKPDIVLPNTGAEELSALAAIIPLQIIAIGYALAKGRDPDKPRNLVRYVDRF
ncbi:MAG: SIS domain-containing protein [Staphylothermus sp.]|nr:SIS domain-containing protein [Staphylothermus sp.]